jgi:hypothetical protein
VPFTFSLGETLGGYLFAPVFFFVSEFLKVDASAFYLFDFEFESAAWAA